MKRKDARVIKTCMVFSDTKKPVVLGPGFASLAKFKKKKAE